MKISNLTECTTAGAVATVAQPFETVQKRTPEKKLKGSNLLKGIKTSKKYANSLHEGEVVQFPGAHTHDNIDCPNCGEPMQGGKMPDGTRVKVCVKCLKYRAEPNQNLPAAAGTPNLSVVKEGAKVDRMVGHVKSSEKKLGKSSKEAENIAWATANKRGMLDNKNKKKDVAEGVVDTVKKGVKKAVAAAIKPVDGPHEWIVKDRAKNIANIRSKREQGVAEGAPELLKKEMPLHRHAEKLLAQNGVSKDDPDYHYHLGNTIKYLRQFGNIDLINKIGEQGVAEGSENILPKGTSVTVLHKGKQVPGKIVRYDTGKGGYSSAYVVDIGKYESIFVPASKIQQGVAEADDKKEWQKQNAKPKQLGKTEKYFSTRHTTKDTGAADKEQGVAEGSESTADIDKQIEFHKQGQAAAQYKGSMNKMHSAKIRELLAKKEALKQGVAEGSETTYEIRLRKDDGDKLMARNVPKSQVGAKLAALSKKHNVAVGEFEYFKTGDLKEQGVAEGRFVKGPGGVPLDRQGNAIPPNPQAEPKAPAVRRDVNGLTRADYNTVWRKIEDVVGQIFPDGDPIDWLGPWLDRQGIKDYHGGEVLNKACRLNGYKDIYAYYDHFKTDDYGYEDPKLKGFLDNGGQVQHGSFKGPRKAEKTDFGSTHIGGGGDKMKASRTGLAARSLGNKIVGLPEEKEKTGSESDISTITDPELRHAIEKAKTHYGGIKDPITAFRKLTVRGLKHAEETDHRQDEKIKDFEQVINRMKQEIFSLRQQVSRPVSEGEITEDDVVLSAERRRPKSGLLSKPEPTTNPADAVKVDIPLLIRLLEFAREDAKTDMDLHDLAEKLIACGARGRTLTMKDYERLVPEKKPEYNDATDSVEPEVDESLLGGAAAAGIVANDDDDFQVSYQRQMEEDRTSHKFRMLAFLKSNEPGDVGQRKEFTITARTDREAKILAKQRLAARGMEVRELHIIGSEEIA